MLINFSNHPSDRWSAEQSNAALSKYGEIVDISFPNVDAYASGEEIFFLAKCFADEIEARSPDAVLCQGEFSLAFATAWLLMKKGIPVICACSERDAEEVVNADGNMMRKTVFKFVRFREYKLPQGI